jgi:hypothetical protein
MPFELGLNTFWLDLHLCIVFLLMGSSAIVFGAIYLSSKADERLIRRLKALSLLSFILVLAVMITGIIPDMNFGFGDTFTYAATNEFGNFTARVSDAGLSQFTGPLLFDIMEHITLIGPAIMGVVTLLIWHYGELVVTDPKIRRSVLTLMLVGAAWLLTLLWIGMYITKILTFAFTS